MTMTSHELDLSLERNPFGMDVAICLVAWSVAPRLFLSGPSLFDSPPQPIMKIFGVERSLDIPVEPTEEELKLLDDVGLPGCEHLWYDSVIDGAKLHYRKMAPAKPVARLVYVHGIQTHGGKSFILDSGRKVNLALLADICKKEGIALYAPDMYGHGYSEGKRWMIPETWETSNLKDLTNFVELIDGDYDSSVPLFFLSESYGGTLTIHLARYYQDNPDKAPKGFAGIMLTGPAIMADMPPYPVYFVIRYMLAPLFPTWIPFFMPNPVSADRIWRDSEVLAMHTTPRMKELSIDSAGTPFRLGTAINMLSALECARSQAIPGLTVPYCIVHGEKDMGVPVEGSEFMVKHAATPKEDAEFHRIPDAYHDLLADPVAEEVAGIFVNFMKKQMLKRK